MMIVKQIHINIKTTNSWANTSYNTLTLEELDYSTKPLETFNGEYFSIEHCSTSKAKNNLSGILVFILNTVKSISSVVVFEID